VRKLIASHCTLHLITTPWYKSANELYRPSDRRLSAKLVPTFSLRGCHVLSVTDPYGCILGFLDQTFRIESLHTLHQCLSMLFVRRLLSSRLLPDANSRFSANMTCGLHVMLSSPSYTHRPVPSAICSNTSTFIRMLWWGSIAMSCGETLSRASP
jgi:hypothetical protein